MVLSATEEDAQVLLARSGADQRGLGETILLVKDGVSLRDLTSRMLTRSVASMKGMSGPA